MNTQTAGIGMIIALIIGGAIGYVSAKPAGDTATQDKKLAEAVTMMKDQSVAIKVMSEMMKSDSMMMQDLGAKYKDESMMSMGKDMKMMSEKYMKVDSSATESDSTMNQMMNQ